MSACASSLLLVAALVVGAPAQAGATSSLTAQGTAAATALTLDGVGIASTHIVKIAELALSSDAPSGFTMTISSGVLSKADGRTSFSFQVVVVDRDAAAPSPSAFVTAAGSPLMISTTAAGTHAKDVYIKYRPAALQDPGNYTATIDLDIVDN